MEEEMVGFLLEFEDKASAGLAAAASEFDLASKQFSDAMKGAVDLLDRFEASYVRVGAALARGSDTWKVSNLRASLLARGIVEATEAVTDFRDTSDFVMDLPREGWKLTLEDDDFIRGGEMFHRGFDKKLKTSSFEKDMAVAIRDGMMSANIDVASSQKRREFLDSKKKSATAKDDPFGSSGFEKALAPFSKFLGQVKGLAVFAALFASFGQIFLPFMEILADVFDTLFAPFEEFLLLVAKSLTPAVDKLSVAMYEGLKPAFDAFLKFLESDIIPILGDLVEALIPVITWVAEVAIEFTKWMADLFSGKKGVEAMNLAIGALIAAAITPFVIAIVVATKAFIAFTVALLTNPITWIVVAIGLIVYALKEWAGGWDKLWIQTKKVFNAIVGFLSPIFKWLGNVFSQVWEAIKEAWNGGLAGIFNLWLQYLSPIAWLKALFSLASYIGEAVMGAIGSLGTMLWDAGKSVMGSLLGGILSTVGGILGAIGDVAGGIVGALWDGITGGLGSWIFPGPFGKLVGWLGSWFKSPKSPQATAKIGGQQTVDAFAKGAENPKKDYGFGKSSAFNLIIEQGIEDAKPKAGQAATTVAEFSKQVDAKVAADPPVAVKVVPEIETDEGAIPTTELSVLSPDEQAAPVVRALEGIGMLLRGLMEQLNVREGEGRVRRELGLLSGFER